MAAAEYLECDGAQIAYRRIKGWGLTIVWLGGFRSDMLGAKAEALAQWAHATGRGYVRFDYFGHGESSGAFDEGTISRWREDALAVLDRLTSGPVILVGSSMGGWLACLVALARTDRIKGLALVAPAADFTHELLERNAPAEALSALNTSGVWLRPSDYGAPYPITRRLIETGVATPS